MKLKPRGRMAAFTPLPTLRRRDELIDHLGAAHDALTKVLAHRDEIPDGELMELIVAQRVLVELIEDNR